MNNINEIIVFRTASENKEFEIILDGEHDTVWASEQQIMDLFGKARRTVGNTLKTYMMKVNLIKGQLGGNTARLRLKAGVM